MAQTRGFKMNVESFFTVKVDVLEIALREQLDLVDHVFIVEATVTHKGVRTTILSEMNWLKIVQIYF